MPDNLFQSVKAKNERKTKRAAKKAIETASATPTPAYPFPPVVFNFSGGQFPFSPAAIPFDASNASQYPSNSSLKHSVAMRSSPAASESDPEHEIEVYMDTLISKNPSKAEKLARFKEQLVDEDMTLKKIHEMKTASLKHNFHISFGLTMDVFSSIKAFQHSRGHSG